MLCDNAVDKTLPSDWIVQGKRPLEVTQSKICSTDVIIDLLEARTRLQTAVKTNPALLRDRFGCFMIACLRFASRAALKLADIAELLNNFASPGRSVLDPTEDVKFVDLYGGRGGFSDYILWRFQAKVNDGWIVKREGKSPPRVKDFRPASAPGALDKLKVCDVDGRDLQGETLEDYQGLMERELRDARGATTLVIGDGVQQHSRNNQTSTARTREMLSTNTFWTQCWSALTLLTKGGTFICQVTDSIGRCMSGSAFLLTGCFERVTIIKPATACPAKSKRFLICLNFKGQDDECVKLVRQHLYQALSKSAKAKSEGKGDDVVEIVPWPHINAVGKAFINSMVKLNERDLGQETSAIKSIEDRDVSMSAARIYAAELQRLGFEVNGPQPSG